MIKLQRLLLCQFNNAPSVIPCVNAEQRKWILLKVRFVQTPLTPNAHHLKLTHTYLQLAGIQGYIPSPTPGS
jgi:hypothetical protein